MFLLTWLVNTAIVAFAMFVMGSSIYLLYAFVSWSWPDISWVWSVIDTWVFRVGVLLVIAAIGVVSWMFQDFNN